MWVERWLQRCVSPIEGSATSSEPSLNDRPQPQIFWSREVSSNARRIALLETCCLKCTNVRTARDRFRRVSGHWMMWCVGFGGEQLKLAHIPLGTAVAVC